MSPTLIAFSVPPWLQFAAFPGILTMFCGAAFLWDLRRRKRLRRYHLASHREIDDAEFVHRIGLDQAGVEGQAACRIRHAIAGAMRVPPRTLHPFDELRYIAAFGFDNLDFIEIAWTIEKALDVRIPDRYWNAFFNSPYRDDLGSLIRFLFDQHDLPADFAAPSAAPAITSDSTQITPSTPPAQSL